MINSCLITCKKHGIDYYREKCRENKIDIDDIEISDRFDELGNEENTVFFIEFFFIYIYFF